MRKSATIGRRLAGVSILCGIIANVLLVASLVIGAPREPNPWDGPTGRTLYAAVGIATVGTLAGLGAIAMAESAGGAIGLLLCAPAMAAWFFDTATWGVSWPGEP